MKKPSFISISGAAGSGKTTISEYLKRHFRENRLTINDFSFAGPLKDCCALWFGWDRQRLDTDFAYKEGGLDEQPDPYCQRFGMTRRQIMQVMGDACMRRGLHPQFWIIMADLGVQLGKIPPSDLYVISDARYGNELDWAQSINAYRILVLRSEIQRNSSDIKTGVTLTTHTAHPSETEFLQWNGYNEQIINLIDQNQTYELNMDKLIHHLNDITIPHIRQRFQL